ncbi:MAG: hypothetical protein ACOYNY_31790, partial [Caldilineaceae bacterium]
GGQPVVAMGFAVEKTLVGVGDGGRAGAKDGGEIFTAVVRITDCLRPFGGTAPKPAKWPPMSR